MPIRRYWVAKTEPDVYSYGNLVRDGRTSWEGVRNYQARNNLRAMEKGDYVVIYHSNTTPPGAVGVAVVVETQRPDPTQFDKNSPYFDPGSSRTEPRWSTVIVEPVRSINPVSLGHLRRLRELEDSAIVRPGNRLSVSELSREAFDAICHAGGIDRLD